MKLQLLMLIAIFSLPFVAASIDSYEAVFDMQEGVVLTSSKVVFDSLADDTLYFTLPPDSEQVILEIDNQLVPTEQDDGSVKIALSNSSSFKISFVTSYYIDAGDFLFDFQAPFDIEKATFSVRIPLGYQLEESMVGSTGSIYPKPQKALTDGQQIIFLWERANMLEGDDLAILIKLKEIYRQSAWRGWLLAIIGLASLVFLFVRQKRRDGPDISRHLKEDEAGILKILKERQDNQIEQATLRIITGIPKATLSRILTELEERKIIIKENRGKKNLILLKK